MKNDKGFTLVELLAVIVILAVILVIAIPNVIKIIDKARLDSYKRTEDMLVSAAQKYMAQQGITLAAVGDTTTVSYNTDLRANNFIDKISDQASKNECINSKVIVTKTITGYTYKPALICDNFISFEKHSLIIYGDFSSSSGWSTENGTTVVTTASNFATTTNTSNTYSVLARGTNGILSASLQNHVLFLKAKVRVKGSPTNQIFIGSSNGLGNLTPAESTKSISSPIVDQWYDIYGTINFGAGNNASTIVKIYMQYADAATALNKQMEVKDVMVIDLTSMYEPNAIPSTDNIYSLINKSR
jgi:type IV pilus assembly protein PilA